MSFPTTTQAWKVTDIQKDSIEGLQLIKGVSVPDLGDHDVLLQIEAISLNYRDPAIPRVCASKLLDYRQIRFISSVLTKLPR